MPGFCWHCVGAMEEGDRVTCWLPLFEEYTSEMPIHLPTEPESYLWKIVINTRTKEVESKTKFDAVGATERCAHNEDYLGEREPRYAYLMLRGDEEMYGGLAKFDLREEKVVARVSYGERRFGGEAMFHPRPGATEEDDGWLMDIVYDKNTEGSELCIWEARGIATGDGPVAKVALPHRVPYGVHGIFLTPGQLRAQPPLGARKAA